MNFDLNNGMPNLYDGMNSRLSGSNPVILIVVTVLIIFYYLVFSSLGVSTQNMNVVSQKTVESLTATEVFFWAIFIFLILINGLQYFFSVDIQAAIKNIFSPTPEIDITLTNEFPEEEEKEPVPEIEYVKQVFNIPGNKYTYEDAKALCKAYGSRLATYDEIENTYNEGGEWCNYGWSQKQMALFPTQKETYNKLQKHKGHENDCGRPGVNGGYIANPNVRFGVNCFGYKPEITENERIAMNNVDPFPLTRKEKQLERKVEHYRKKLPEIEVSPFNHTRWSVI
jgi:hypothetical protein